MSQSKTFMGIMLSLIGRNWQLISPLWTRQNKARIGCRFAARFVQKGRQQDIEGF
jgi:hypothetical protein